MTDHDTTAGLAEAAEAAAAHQVRLVPGIEITSVVAGRDVHVLGYFFDPEDAALLDFLRAQRADRVNRAREIGRRLAALGKPIDLAPLLARAEAEPGFSLGRPAIAQLLVDAGHVSDRNTAFDALIGDGQPACVPRSGATPADVARIVRAAGGIVSLAHPVLVRDQARVPEIAKALDAIEVHHSEHRADDVARYRALAGVLGSRRAADPTTTVTRADRGRPSARSRSRSQPSRRSKPGYRTGSHGEVHGPAPAFVLQDISKVYGGLRPLRVRSLVVPAGAVIALTGVDAPAAETLVNLLTGATLPDTGEVRVFGRATCGDHRRRRVADHRGSVRHRRAIARCCSMN